MERVGEHGGRREGESAQGDEGSDCDERELWNRKLGLKRLTESGAMM